MCMSCFKQYTDAPVINERVLNVVKILADRNPYKDSDLLHVITSDFNCDDWLFDLDQSDLEPAYRYAPSDDRRVFDEMAKLTEAERATALAINWGYFDEEGKPIVPFSDLIRTGRLLKKSQCCR